MKQTAFLFAATLVLAASVGAQTGLDKTLAPVPAGSAAASDTSASPLFASAAVPATGEANAPDAAVANAPDPSPADTKPTVYGVLQSYNWQATAGYTFLRLYLAPHVTENMNGLNLGLVYYPGGKWIGADGQFIGAWGSLFGFTAKYVQAMGGPRFRWAAPRGIEVWGHGLVGGAHFLPQTAFGGQSAFAYEVGGGVDLNRNQKRIAYRVSADMVGTRFFGTYQYSPTISAGVVYRF